MDIPINVDVHCADGLCGQSTYVIINPVVKKVTHLVLKAMVFPHTEYLVPLALVAESTPHLIRLRCTKDELHRLEPFIETQFVQADPYYAADAFDLYEGYRLWPYVIPETMTVPVEYERVPPGELAVRRGARVRSTDGPVGWVDEFLVDPTNAHITHLVLREGHLWGQKDVTIPVSEIERIEENTVYLKLNKHDIGRLPAIPIRRR
jgi:hypothetical protein